MKESPRKKENKLKNTPQAAAKERTGGKWMYRHTAVINKSSKGRNPAA